jgi:hypothetical protein
LKSKLACIDLNNTCMQHHILMPQHLTSSSADFFLAFCSALLPFAAAFFSAISLPCNSLISFLVKPSTSVYPQQPQSMKFSSLNHHITIAGYYAPNPIIHKENPKPRAQCPQPLKPTNLPHFIKNFHHKQVPQLSHSAIVTIACW